ncbi:MAG: YihY/virulence factor BrkB family protein [Actinomadura sp.]
MRQVIGGVRRGVATCQERAIGVLRRGRRRWSWLDHLARAYTRYHERRGDRLAAAVTYFGFLSFFPLLALAYALLGYLVGVSDRARRYLVEAIDSVLPGLAGQVPVEQIAEARATAGIIGLAGLLITGVGCVDALREALRDIWGKDPAGGGHLLVKKLWNIVVLLFLGTMLMLSVAISTVTTSATHGVLEVLGLDRTAWAGTALRLLGVAIAIVFNTLIFLVLFARLSGGSAPWRGLLRGALLGAIGFEALKLIATFLVGLTTGNPVYASFAVVVGMLVWINVVSRFTLYVAAWTATQAQDSS